jgi:hypothetical protein
MEILAAVHLCTDGCLAESIDLHGTAVNPVETVGCSVEMQNLSHHELSTLPERCTYGHIAVCLCQGTGGHQDAIEAPGSIARGGGPCPSNWADGRVAEVQGRIERLLQEKTSSRLRAWMEARLGERLRLR